MAIGEGVFIQHILEQSRTSHKKLSHTNSSHKSMTRLTFQM